MSVAIRYIVGGVMIGLFFWVIFVVLIVWTALVRAIEWLADSSTESVARLTVQTGSLASEAWKRSHVAGRLSAFRTATRLSDQKLDLPAERMNVAHVIRQFVDGHGLFRN